MIINTAGEYTLQYTATDACGNSTTVERELTVEEPPTYRTVLYTDGTFIINESSRDEAANIQAHGVATNVYVPFDPNGNKYKFTTTSQRPWDSQKYSITSVEIGSNISPTSTSFWFSGLTDCTSIDLTKLDTSAVTDMSYMFSSCQSLTSLDLSNFNTSAVTNMSRMFDTCNRLTNLDLSSFNTSSVTDMSYMFNGCTVLTSLDLSSFNTSSVMNMQAMLRGCRALTSLDLSSFNTSSVTDMSYMFSYCTTIANIYTSANFIVSQVTSSSDMFANMSTNLVGGAGTVWNSSYVDKTRAKIDGGTSDPGYFTARS